jgi:ribose 1,5-bisphosphokinase PhnN
MSLISMNLKHSEHRRESHHKNLIATGTANRSAISKRRSNRMSLHAPVDLSGEDRKKSAFAVPARATNLNRYGASVQLNRELTVGSVVVVQNKRGIQVSARIVAQLTAVQGVSTYGIEFVEQDEKSREFWGISFPSYA